MNIIFRVRSLQSNRFILPLAALLLALLSSCETQSSAQQVIAPPVREIVATLEDEVRELPSKRIAWSTYWKLCWQSYPGAKAYELQTLTSEGGSPKLRRISDRCFRLQAAVGQNHKSQGLFNRKAILSLQASQLAYRVRAVLDDNLVSEWSPDIAVGTATGCLGNCKNYTKPSSPWIDLPLWGSE